MTRQEAASVVALMNAYCHRDAIEEETFSVFVEEFTRLANYEAALKAARLIGTDGRFPTLREFKVAYRQQLDRASAGRELEAPDDSVPPPQEVIDWWRDRQGKIGRSID